MSYDKHVKLTLCMLLNFSYVFVVSWLFLKINFFKIFFQDYYQSVTVSIQIRPDALIGVKNVCKGYPQTKPLVDKV